MRQESISIKQARDVIKWDLAGKKAWFSYKEKEEGEEGGNEDGEAWQEEKAWFKDQSETA